MTAPRYCSGQCQTKDWKRHKAFCGKSDDPAARALKAKVEAEADAQNMSIEALAQGPECGHTICVPNIGGAGFYLRPTDEVSTFTHGSIYGKRAAHALRAGPNSVALAACLLHEATCGEPTLTLLV
jgi:hypothetical protein